MVTSLRVRLLEKYCSEGDNNCRQNRGKEKKKKQKERRRNLARVNKTGHKKICGGFFKKRISYSCIMC